jgi:hypothetical protein
VKRAKLVIFTNIPKPEGIFNLVEAVSKESASFFLFRRRVLDLPDKKNRGEDAFRLLGEKSLQKLKFGAKQPVFDDFWTYFSFYCTVFRY